MKNSSILVLVLFITIISACKPDKNNAPELLLGRWEVIEASRNGRPTESLADLYFEFTHDGKLMTNVTGIPEEGTYEVRGDQVLQRNTQLDADYNIEEITEDKLVLATELRGYAFLVAMNKSDDEAPQPQEGSLQSQ